jgi:hypothetical protein
VSTLEASLKHPSGLTYLAGFVSSFPLHLLKSSWFRYEEG